MKTVSASKLKTHFSEVLRRTVAGEEIGITHGPKKKIFAKLVPTKDEKKSERKIGILDGKCTVKFAKDFKIDYSDLIGD